MQKSDFPLERMIGIHYYLTDTPGMGGRLRQSCEDFRVTEVPVEKEEEPDGDYTYFTLEKTNWDTIRALSALSKALGVSRKRFGFAGTKDRRALTRQQIAVWKVPPERLEKVSISGLRLSSFRRCGERLNMGELLGNEFEITVREPLVCDGEVIGECQRQVAERGVPNYFGYQRFGVIRPNTHVIGERIVKGDVEGAVMSYLADHYDGEQEDAREARKALKETMDFKAALESFPRRLGYERAMLDHLARHPTDFAGALRRLHKKLRQMLVHGYQSYLFNLVLSRIIEEGMDIHGVQIPLFGYRTVLSQGRQGEIEREVLEEHDVELQDFRIPMLPELSSRGAMRQALLEPDVRYRQNRDGSFTFRFFLSKGNYATMVMREFMKTDPVNY
ncbi:MAG: tRNA pseudouridine(13) synthase TruD [Methanobacteriota archaeon]|nr:MAG: tRNA pseudouridine(13) synthase TruD [Euryarchaeota archaeon]